jgi:hypothetical protein
VRTGSGKPRLFFAYDGESLRLAHAQTCGQLGKAIVGAQRGDLIVEAYRLLLQSLTLRCGSRDGIA